MNLTSTARKVIAGSLLLLSVPASFALEGRVLFEPRCPVTQEAQQHKELTPLAVAFAGKVVGALTGAAIDALAGKLSEERHVTVVSHERKPNWYTQSAAAAGGNGKYLMNSNLVCLVVAVGEGFHAPRAVVPEEAFAKNWPQAPDSADPVALDYSRLKRAASDLAALGIVNPPAFYVEYRVTVLEGGSAFALDPRFVYYPSFLGDKAWLAPNTRDLLVQIEFSEPGSETPFAQTSMQFHGLQPGKLSTQRVEGVRMPWQKQPSTGNGESGDGRLVPFNIKAMFTETAKPGKLGTILAGVLNDQKASLVSAAETKAKLSISESERQAARSNAADAANTALTNYIAAYDAHEAAVKARDAAKAGTDQAAIAKAEIQLTLARTRLANAQSLARSAFEAADIPFTPIPAS